MNAAEFQAAWSEASAQIFPIFGQPVVWNKKTYTAIIDGLPESSKQRSGGGGYLEDFQGTIIFQKVDFAAPHFPKVGQRVEIGHRSVRIVEVRDLGDVADPTITCLYKATST